jgi:hypothetical protein
MKEKFQFYLFLLIHLCTFETIWLYVKDPMGLFPNEPTSFLNFVSFKKK